MKKVEEAKRIIELSDRLQQLRRWNEKVKLREDCSNYQVRLGLGLEGCKVLTDEDIFEEAFQAVLILIEAKIIEAEMQLDDLGVSHSEIGEIK